MTPLEAMAVALRSRRVHGWFSLEAHLLFAWIDDLQREQGQSGDLFEIGVHKGRSAVLLSHMTQPGESLGVCDLFGDQNQNVSRSGSGDRLTFETNMRLFGRSPVDLRVFAKASSELSAGEIGARYRFFHIDGGHNTDEALGDLRLSADCVLPSGAVVVDDAFNGNWPGVTEAIVRFLDERRDYAPVVLGFNKMVITQVEAVESYARHFDERGARDDRGLGYPWHLKKLPFLGRPLRIFHVPTAIRRGSLGVRVANLRRSRPWARRWLPASAIEIARRALP